ncbi:MAG: N-6 DNA methylase [Tannerella sp.]|nr:N-6 DNA methylase [Tannerella sp.]
MKEYAENLRALDFQFNNQVNSSIYFVDKLKDYIADTNISPYIIIALDKAKSFEADAVYFRFFDDERPPMPQLYIYDNITKNKSADYYAQKHKDIWSSCEIASFLVIDETSVKIFDSRKPVKTEKDKITITSEPIKELNLSKINDIAKEFKAYSFDNGSFWENKEMRNHFLNSRIASERLMKGLKDIRVILRKNNTLSKDLIDQLLIVCILIKYLEETGIDRETEQNINLAHKFFEEKTGYAKLEDIIRNNKLVQLLSALAEHFNGGIFNIDDRYIQELNNKDISELAQFFDAGYKNNLFGWKEYSFEYIPVELISNFYEELIPKTTTEDEKTEEKSKKETGAVYTPNFLVNLLIDECLPLNKNNLDKDIKLLDPACGSGIFLVSAYKRLVQRWRIKNQLANPTADKLKEILKNNIFGVDVNSKSVNLSVFSLQLALCSMLTPKQIWTEFQFDDLQENKNIVQKDFFEYLVDKNVTHNFDLVIGNPPFKRNILDGKSYEYYGNLLEENRYPIKFKNPQKEFAYLFLEKSMHFLSNKQGKLCLILPSGPLLYSKDSVSVRKSLFSTYNVSQIIDFTFLRRVLFPATVATLAIFVDNNQPTEKLVRHITAKRTKQSKEHYYFEFDHYDFHNLPKDLVTDKINVWKCNLAGGLIVCDIIAKLNKIKPKFKDFWLSNNIRTYNDNINKEDVFPAYKKEIENNSLFPQEVLIPMKSKTYWGIRKKITKGVFPTEIVMDDFKKKDTFDGIGFCGSAEDIEQLKKYIKNYSEWICFYIAATSGRQGVRSPYVMCLSDMEKFPFVENLKDYISCSDKIIIEDIAKYTLDEFGNGEKAQINTLKADENTLKEFSQIYSESLNVFYRSGNKRYTLTNIKEGDAYFVCDIEYTDKNIFPIPFSETEDKINSLLFDWNLSGSKKINKIIFTYGNDVIRIIKPKQLRYWLKSKALRDADETVDFILTHNNYAGNSK